MPEIELPPQLPESQEGTPLAEALPSTPPPAGPLETAEGRWGDIAPQWLQGKNANETLDIVTRLATAIQQQYAAAAQPTVEPMPQPVATPINDDLLVTDPAEWRRQFAASVNADVGNTLAAAATPIYANIADTAATLSRNDPNNKDVAAKWWAEVEQMVAPIPAHMRSKALYDQASKMARSNHLEDIVTERAAALAAAGTGLESASPRGAGGPGTSEGTDATWDKISKSAIGAKMIAQYGKGKVAATAKQMNITLDKYADMIAGSRTIVDPEKSGTWYSELHVAKERV